MKVSDVIVKFLEEKGVKFVFGYIGGMITHLVDSISSSEKIKYIQVYHEQTGAIAAEGYARESQKFGVAISTSGPGVTNMITGIADAYFDSIPVIYISGQVNTNDCKFDKPIRQQGFQETDVVSLVKSITKYAQLITNPNDILFELEKAYYYATEGRKGPVLLDIPINIQYSEVEISKLSSFKPTAQINNEIPIEEVRLLIKKASKPIIISGGGINSSTNAKETLNKFLEKSKFPVVTSLMGRGSVNDDYRFNIGMIGSYGNRCANIAIANSDLIIALGSRLDTRQTGSRLDSFSKGKAIIHVDIDQVELTNHRLKNRLQINTDVDVFLHLLLHEAIDNTSYSAWWNYLEKLKEMFNQENEIRNFVNNKLPYQYIEMLNNYTQEGDIVCADIGQNQMWAAQSIKIKKNQHFYTSGGLAPMGYSLPVAIGAAFANPEANVFSINGDGGFHMAIQSLMLISQYNLSVKVIIFNNLALGMITQFQDVYFEGRKPGTVSTGGYKVPDIRNIAISYGLKYFRLDSVNYTDHQLQKDIFSNKNCVIECIIDGSSQVSPKLEFNNSIENVSPLLDGDILKKYML